jgi:hypothetical protein
VPDLAGILEPPRRAEGVLRRKRDGHVEGAVGGVKLAPDVRVGVPALLVVLGHLGIPLRHRVVDAFTVVASGAARLQRHLRAKAHPEGSRFARQDRLGQIDAHHRVGNLVVQRLAVLREALDAVVADLVGAEVEEARHDAPVGIRQVAVAFRHHRVRVEGVEIQMIVHAPERVGRVVGVAEALHAAHFVAVGQERDVHVVAHALLPAVVVAVLGAGEEGEHEKQRRDQNDPAKKDRRGDVARNVSRRDTAKAVIEMKFVHAPAHWVILTSVGHL